MGNTLRIARQHIGKGIFTPTKDKDFRLVPLSDELRSELLDCLQEVRNNSPKVTLFQTLEGTPIDRNNFRNRIFNRDVKDSGLKWIRFHDLRHTALTLMVRRGVLLPVVQKIAGHEDIKTTMRYVHVLGRDIEDVGNSFTLAK